MVYVQADVFSSREKFHLSFCFFKLLQLKAILLSRKRFPIKKRHTENAEYFLVHCDKLSVTIYSIYYRQSNRQFSPLAMQVEYIQFLKLAYGTRGCQIYPP